MRVVSWNLYNRNRDVRAILGYLRAADADVLALQEVSARHLDALAGLDGYGCHVAEDFSERGELSHLALLSRLPVTAYEAVPINRARCVSPSLVGRARGWVECLEAQQARIEVAGRAVRLVNLHLSAAASPAHRRRELESALAAVGVDQRLVVCGDFNSFARPWIGLLAGWAYGFGPSELCANEDRALTAFAARHGLVRALGRAVTYPRFGLPLDHVLARGLGPPHGRVEPATHGSDHRPVMVDFPDPASGP